MQDRFKFRAWNNKHKMFIKDNSYPIGSDYQLILNQDGELIELGLGDYEEFSEHTQSWATYEKFEDCVIQFCTGLKDKNGKLIYEGDIVKDLLLDENCIVVHRKAEYTLKSKYGSYIGFNTDVQEIIGNKYENPELLEAENANNRI